MRRILARAVASSVVVILSFTTVPLTFAQSQQPASDQQTSPSGSEQPPSQTPDATPQSGHQPPIELPENPGRSNAPQSTTTAPTQPAQQSEPNGTAVAPPIETTGGAASKPAGVAIAPPKQRQIHSLLIKLGFLAGAGVALGTVVGLSAASPSRVPNSPTPSGPGH
jgi:hypothetical protein